VQGRQKARSFLLIHRNKQSQRVIMNVLQRIAIFCVFFMFSTLEEAPCASLESQLKANRKSLKHSRAFLCTKKNPLRKMTKPEEPSNAFVLIASAVVSRESSAPRLFPKEQQQQPSE
jgi:hypothetical protein